MLLTIGFAFALGVLFPVLMDSFNEGRERIGEFKSVFSIDDKRVSGFVRSPGGVRSGWVGSRPFYDVLQ